MKVNKKLLVLLTVALGMGISGCSKEEQKTQQKPSSKNVSVVEKTQTDSYSSGNDENLDNYTIESITDTNIANAEREILHIVVNEDYSPEQLYKIAQKEALKYTKDHDVNALTIGFYTDKDNIGEGYDMGSVLYAPNGEIGESINVTAGDYSSFKFVDNLDRPIKDNEEKTNNIQVSSQELYVDVQESMETQNGKVRFNIKTNLPDTAELMVGISDLNGDYRGQTKAIVNNGEAQTEWFSYNGNPLESSTYTVSISMSMPILQSEKVQSIVGKKGENMKGELVKRSSVDDYAYVTKESTIEI